MKSRTCEELTDEVLSTRSREGDDEAFADLYRRHRPLAARTARHILHSSNDVDDVVAEAFTSVLSALRGGKGPRDNFRAYLLACVRNRCYVRRRPPTPTVDEQLESLSPAAVEDPERYVEADTVARAFASLRPRWQRTLWLSEVEQLPAPELADELHLGANATAALALRARHAFAAAYLSEHLSAPPATVECAAVGPRLGAFVRDDLGPKERATVASHVEQCASCQRAVDELADLNSSLRSLEGPSIGLAVAGAGVGGVVAAGSVAGSGVWAAVGGASLFVKVAAAALLVVPTAAIVTRRLSTDAAKPTPQPATAVVVPAGTTAGGATTGTADGRPGLSYPTATSLPRETAAGNDPPVVLGPAGISPTVNVGLVLALTVGAGGPAAAATAITVTAIIPTVGPVTVGSVAVAGVTLPAVIVAPVVVPSLPRLPVTLPPVTLPRITLPPVTLPAVIPAVTVPVTLPRVTLPPATLPVAVPPVTLPPATLPPVTLPPVTLPPVTLPPVTLPPIGPLTLG